MVLSTNSTASGRVSGSPSGGGGAHGVDRQRLLLLGHVGGYDIEQRRRQSLAEAPRFDSESWLPLEREIEVSLLATTPADPSPAPDSMAAVKDARSFVRTDFGRRPGGVAGGRALGLEKAKGAAVAMAREKREQK